jgi:hypothetical protein
MVARLAGSGIVRGLARGAMGMVANGYNTAIGRGVIGLAEDTGFGLLFGASPAEAAISAVGGRGGAFAGARIGKAINPKLEGIGEMVGGGLGNVAGYMGAQQLMPADQLVDTPNSASANVDKSQFHTEGAYRQPLTQDDVRIQAQQAKLIAAQYALQSYATPPPR